MTPVAHGIGGIRDLPVPTYLFFYGAAIVLAVSFVALAVLWRRPLLEAKAEGRPLPPRAQRVLLSPVLRAGLGAASVTVLAVVWLAALIGKSASGANLAPTFVYVLFWVGLVPFVVLLGNVWSVLSPWKAAADGAAWLTARLGIAREPRFAYPERLGRRPAAALLFGFVTLELAYVDPASPRKLALAIALYSVATWAGAAAFGREAWFERGDGFSVYFGLLARIAPLARRNDGRIVARMPFSGLAVREYVPGTIPFVAVMLGSVLFDGFSRTSLWQNRYYDVQVNLLDRPGLADLAGTLMSLAGLAVAVTLVGLAFRAAVAGTEWVGRRSGLAADFAGSLVPIALVYVVAHYFSLLVLQGQVGVRLISDPFGRGWDVFGTQGFQPDFGVLTPNTIWYVQVGALVAGHVAGLGVAHDRAVSLFRTPRMALWTQYPMLVLMVAYTVAGLWVLSQG